MTPAASSKSSSVDAFVSKSAWQFCISVHSLTTPGALEAGGFVWLTSLTRTNSSAHLQFTNEATTGPVPVYHVQRRAAFGPGAWADLPGPIGDTNILVHFLDPTATNAQNFYRVRVRP